MVGNGVGAGALDLPKKEAMETGVAFEFAFLFIVDVEEVEFVRAVCPRNTLEQMAHYCFAERIEEEEQAGAGGKQKLGGIAAADLRGCDAVSVMPPNAQIATRYAGQRRMNFHADDFTEWHFGGEKYRAPHAGAHIDKRKLAYQHARSGLPPSLQQPAEDRGRDPIIGRGVAIMTMSALEVPAGD